MDQMLEFVSNHALLSLALVVIVFLIIKMELERLTSGIEQVNPFQAIRKLNDQDAVVIGERVYGADTVVPGMKYAAVTHVPVLGGAVRSVDTSGLGDLADRVQVVTIDRLERPYGSLGAVGVVAEERPDPVAVADLQRHDEQAFECHAVAVAPASQKALDPCWIRIVGDV